MPQDQSSILEQVQQISQNGEISCSAALKLAEKLGITPMEIGQAANTLHIKIRVCQLGCFK